MRCRKAKAKIDQGDRTDPELLAHLAICPSCAKLASAQAILDSAIGDVRIRAIDQSSDLALLKAKLAARQTTKEPIAMLKHAFASHPKAGIGLAVFVAAVLFLTLVPIPYQRIAGYDVSFAGVSGVVPQDQLSKALMAVGHGNIDVSITASNEGTEYKFSSLPTYKAAKEVAAAFAALTKTAVSPQISPRFETVSASLYAQAREKERRVEIEVNGDGKTDEQIKAEIEAKLAAQGFTGSLVYLKTDSIGKKEIKLQLEQSDSCPPGLSTTTVEIDTHGKTNDQIKAEVESKLAAQGHPEAKVKISSTGVDSLRKVEIQIENCDPTKQ